MKAGRLAEPPRIPFAVSESTAIKLVQKWEQTGSLEPSRIGGYRPFALAAHEKLVRELIAQAPDQTLDELRDRLAGRGVIVGRTSVHRYLSALGLTRLKLTLHAAEQDRPDVEAARSAWRKDQPCLFSEHLVFLDEIWIKTNMARTHAELHVASGQSAPYRVAIGRPAPFLAALRCDRLSAPCAIDGPINGLTFQAYVEQILVPTLASGDM